MEGLESDSIMTGTSYHDDLSNMDEDTRGGDYTIVEGDGGEASVMDSADTSMMIDSQTMDSNHPVVYLCHSPLFYSQPVH